MTIADPFASAPAQEEAQQPASEPAAQPAAAEKPAVQNVFAPGEGKIVTTLKAGAGYDQPWVVIHANSVEESNALLDQKFADYLGRVKKVAAFFNGGGVPVQAQNNGGGQQQSNGRPQGATEPPAWAPPKPYDDFVYKTGFSQKTNKTWHAWMPPTKGDNREALFFNPPR